VKRRLHVAAKRSTGTTGPIYSIPSKSPKELILKTLHMFTEVNDGFLEVSQAVASSGKAYMLKGLYLVDQEFRGHKLSAIADELVQHDNAVTTKALYIMLNTVNEEFRTRMQVDNKYSFGKVGSSSGPLNGDVPRRSFILIDFDSKLRFNHGKDSNATNEELRECVDLAYKVKAYLAERGFKDPVESFSGNGFHLLYRIDTIIDVDSDLDVSIFLHGLSGKFSTPDVDIDAKNFDPKRITKLYGTMTRKGEGSDERPVRRSYILEHSEENYKACTPRKVVEDTIDDLRIYVDAKQLHSSMGVNGRKVEHMRTIATTDLPLPYQQLAKNNPLMGGFKHAARGTSGNVTRARLYTCPKCGKHGTGILMCSQGGYFRYFCYDWSCPCSHKQQKSIHETTQEFWNAIGDNQENYSISESEFEELETDNFGWWRVKRDKKGKVSGMEPRADDLIEYMIKAYNIRLFDAETRADHRFWIYDSRYRWWTDAIEYTSNGQTKTLSVRQLVNKELSNVRNFKAKHLKEVMDKMESNHNIQRLSRTDVTKAVVFSNCAINLEKHEVVHCNQIIDMHKRGEPMDESINFKFKRVRGGKLHDMVIKLIDPILHRDQVREVQQMLGLSIFDYRTNAGFMWVLEGPSDSGKSTLIKLLQEIIGHRKMTSVDLGSMAGDSGEGITERASLVHSILNVCDDIERKDVPGTGMVCRIASRNTIRGRFLYENSFEFTPPRMIFSTNAFPNIPQEYAEITKRVIITRITKANFAEGIFNRITGLWDYARGKDYDKRDTELIPKILRCEEAVNSFMNWIWDGYEDAVASNYNIDFSATTLTRRTQSIGDNNPLAAFVKDNVEITGNPNDKEPAKYLKAAFESLNGISDKYKSTNRAFCSKIRNAFTTVHPGIELKTTQNPHLVFYGIKLKSYFDRDGEYITFNSEKVKEKVEDKKASGVQESLEPISVMAGELPWS